MKKVSVIIPVYNCDRYVEKCILSVINQTYKDIEIVVVDDGSNDNSVTVVSDLKDKYPQIKLIKKQKNEGVSAARNTGIDEAIGELILFLDADDAIVPYYVETLAKKQMETGAVILGYRLQKIENDDFDKAFIDLTVDHTQEYRVYSLAKTKELLSDMGANWDTTAIGGKLISRECIGNNRFEIGMKYGEDTRFIHHLINNMDCDKETIVFVRANKAGYLYRMHDSNAVKEKYSNPDLSYNDYYFEEAESFAPFDTYDKKRESLFWMNRCIYQLKLKYEQSDSDGKNAVIEKFKEMVQLQAFNNLPFVGKMHIRLFIISPFVSEFLKKSLDWIKWRFKLAKNMFKSVDRKVGILTFHCSDNYGAMLQSYGLKRSINSMEIAADIVNYSPLFMTGRHLFIPYMPAPKLKTRYNMTKWGWKLNRKVGLKFYRLQRKSMKDFRNKIVIPYGNKKITDSALKIKKYGAYVVGSDQIWNPDITFGLRNAYFEPVKGVKTVAYAASLGGNNLTPEYKEDFSKKISGLVAISMREKSSVDYVKSCLVNSNIEVTSVCDPVFLLKPGEWYNLASMSKIKVDSGYILVHITESNKMIEEYVKDLATRTDKRIVRLARVIGADASDAVVYDTTAGPGELIQYIHKADYVITNSFHATAFAIIFKKQLAIATHSTRGARLNDLLEVTGLEKRMINEETFNSFDINEEIDWFRVSKEVAKLREEGRRFLRDNLKEFVKNEAVS